MTAWDEPTLRLPPHRQNSTDMLRKLSKGETAMLIFNGIIHTMEGSLIENGYIRVEGTAIAEVGPMSRLPEVEGEKRLIDARGGHVLPGFIDAHCHVGLYGAGMGAPGDDLNEDTDPCTPHIHALDGINPLDAYFREARRAGITCVHTGPGSTNPIAGRSALVKTAGTVVDRMAVLPAAAMKFALGETPKKCHRDGPVTRMGVAALIREQLRKGEGDLAAVTGGRLPAHFHAHRADDIATALRLSNEFGLRCVIVHGTEGYLIADELAQANVPVITGPIMTDRSKPELANMIPENAALLSRAGVRVAICTDHPETPIGYLPLCAALAARAGMDEEEALAAITLNAACILGVEDRIGSLSAGKDADIVIMDGHPFDWRSRVTHVFIDGQEVD